MSRIPATKTAWLVCGGTRRGWLGAGFERRVVTKTGRRQLTVAPEDREGPGHAAKRSASSTAPLSSRAQLLDMISRHGPTKKAINGRIGTLSAKFVYR